MLIHSNSMIYKQRTSINQDRDINSNRMVLMIIIWNEHDYDYGHSTRHIVISYCWSCLTLSVSVKKTQWHVGRFDLSLVPSTCMSFSFWHVPPPHFLFFGLFSSSLSHIFSSVFVFHNRSIFVPTVLYYRRNGLSLSQLDHPRTVECAYILIVSLDPDKISEVALKLKRCTALTRMALQNCNITSLYQLYPLCVSASERPCCAKAAYSVTLLMSALFLYLCAVRYSCLFSETRLPASVWVSFHACGWPFFPKPDD